MTKNQRVRRVLRARKKCFLKSRAGAGKFKMLRNNVCFWGGSAAYKSLDLIRRLREEDIFVQATMASAARRVVTKLFGRKPDLNPCL